VTTLKAIRRKCLDCMGGSRREVRYCATPDCPLYLFRFGRHPRPEDYHYYPSLSAAEADAAFKRKRQHKAREGEEDK